MIMANLHVQVQDDVNLRSSGVLCMQLRFFIIDTSPFM